MTVWIVILEDRHADTSVDVYESEASALAAATTLVRDYDKDRPADDLMVRKDHGDGVISWFRDDGPAITLERKKVVRG